MKEYDITLRIGSDTLTLKDISEIIKRKPISGSYNKGDMRGRKISNKTWFFVMSWKSLSDISIIRANRVINKMKNAVIARRDLGRYVVVLNIAVFCDFQMASITIPEEIVHWASSHGMEIDVTTYLGVS
jgi:hypothetical protein